MPHKKWDKFYQERGRFYLRPHESLQRTINRFKHFEVKKILDLGCGSGRHLIPLAEEGFSVTGIDFSPSAASLAEKWLKANRLQGKVYVADFYEELTAFKNESFDAVVAINAIHYTDIAQFTKTLQEINRVLITGGLLLLVVPSEETKITDLDIEQLIFEEDELKKLLETTFRILEFRRDKTKNFVVVGQEK